MACCELIVMTGGSEVAGRWLGKKLRWFSFRLCLLVQVEDDGFADGGTRGCRADRCFIWSPSGLMTLDSNHTQMRLSLQVLLRGES